MRYRAGAHCCGLLILVICNMHAICSRHIAHEGIAHAQPCGGS